MSLQVWLPLTKDTRNQGLATGTISWTTTATFTNNGKLGKALTTGGCKMPASMTAQALNNQAVTIACWLFVNADADDSTNRAMIFGNSSMSTLGGRQFSIFRYPNSDDIHLSWQNCINGTYSTIVSGLWSGVLTPHAWNHICITYNNPTAKIYVNGIQIGTASGNMSTDSYNFDTQLIYNSTSHYINDFRIYNHCLSPMEVKELAKGLVLHYNLSDDSIETSQNLCTAIRPGAAVNSTWGGHVTQWTLYDATNDPVPFNDGIKGEIVYGQNGSTGGGASRSIATIAASPSTTYTYSCYVKPSDNFSYTSANFLYKYEYTAVSGGSKVTEAGYFNTSRKQYMGDGWYRIWGTFTTKSNTNALNISFYTYPCKSMTYWIGGWQIEQKDHVTPFMKPNTSRNNQNVYDNSGFCNNGTANNIIISIDTPKYKYSSTFNGTNSYIKVNDNNWMIKGMTEMTVNLWAKATTWPTNGGRLVSCTESGGFNLEAGNSGYWRFPIYVYINSGQTSSAYKYDSNEIKIADLIPNEWNMITLVYDNTGTKTYLNGELHHTYTNTSYGINFNTNARLFLGCEANTASPYTPYFNGKECDFRIYATALSADDVKSLYQNCATIDPDGTIRGQIRS